jgi:hypothetical protein
MVAARAMRTLRLVAASFVTLLLGSAAHAIPITTCNTLVPVNDVGVLQNDVVCDTDDLEGVLLAPGATLDLNGFSLVSGSASEIGVVCLARRCQIQGPGVIDGASGNWVSVWLEDRVKLTIRDVTIRDAGLGIAGSFGARLVAQNVTLENHAEFALAVPKIAATNVTVTGSGEITLAAVLALKLTGEDVNVSDNPATGIAARSIRVENLTVNDNEFAGIEAIGSVTLSGASTAFGNDADGEGIDLLTLRRPRLRDTSQCGRSSGQFGAPWGVCVND